MANSQTLGNNQRWPQSFLYVAVPMLVTILLAKGSSASASTAAAADPLRQQQRQRRTEASLRRSTEGGRQLAQTTDLLTVVSRLTSERCQLDANGLYGNAVAATDGTSQVYTVQYLYQTSVVSGTTTAQLNSIVIPALDRAVPTAILPTFFSNCKGINRRRRLQTGTVEAISAMPVDTFILSGRKYSIIHLSFIDVREGA